RSKGNDGETIETVDFRGVTKVEVVHREDGRLEVAAGGDASPACDAASGVHPVGIAPRIDNEVMGQFAERPGSHVGADVDDALGIEEGPLPAVDQVFDAGSGASEGFLIAA